MIKPNKCINCRVLIIKGNTDKLNYRHLLSCVSYDERENCQLYYQIQQCESISEIYGEEPCDCILIDWELCDRQAEEFLQQLSQDSVPIVILAEAKNQPLFSHIAQDVLIKETLTPEFLDFAVQQAIAKSQLKKQLAEAERVSYEHRQSEINLQAFLNNAPAIIFTKDLAGRYLSINHEFEVKLQTSFAQICDKTDLDFLPPETAKTLRQNDRRAISEKRAIHVEETVELEDGLHTYIATKFPLLDEQGEPFGMAGISIDISDRIAIENSLKVQNRVLEKIAKGEALSDILDLLVLGIESQLQQVFCSIMICDRQGKMICQSAPNLPKAYKKLTDGIQHGEGVGSCGTAIFRREVVITSDIATDPLWQDFKELALEHGLRACWSVPIASSDGNILGAFGVYRREISAPQDQELEVITLAANIAGIALERERTTQDLHQLNQELEDRVEQRTIALTESEQLLDLFFNNSLDGFFFMMLDQPIIWNDNIDKELTLDYVFSHQRMTKVNRAMVNQYGEIEEELLGLTPMELFAHDLEQGKTAWRNLFDQGRWKVDTNERRLDGSHIWVEGDYICLYDQEGRITGHFGVQRDISDRKKAELENQALKERLEFVISSSPAITYAFKIDGKNAKTTFISENIKFILGYTSQEFLADPNFWNTHVHPADAPQVFAEIPNLFNNGMNTVEYRFLHQDGTYRWLQDQAQVIRDQADIPIEFVGSLSDISDRKKAELELTDNRENLRQSEELLRLTLENTPVGIATFDLDADFLSANQYMCQIFGYAFDEIFQKNMLLLTHPDSVELTLAAIKQLTDGTEKSIRLEKQYIHKSGRIIDAISRVSLVKDTNGEPLHFVASVEDITEQKQIAIAQKQQMDRQEFLMNITQQIRQSLNLEEVLETAVNEVKRLLNCDRAIIFQLFDDGETQIVKEAVEPNYPSILNRKWHDEHFTNEGFEFYINANVRIVPEVSNDKWTSRSLEFMQEAQVKSKIAVPIIQHINPQVSSQADQETPQIHRWCKGNSQLWGLLIVHSCEKIRQWQPEEVELLQQLANQLAIAIQQANLYKQVQDELLENKRLNLIVNNELVQKKVLLREIHHRVKNNLQVMSSILYLQFRHTPPEIKLLSEEYQNRIYSMALIHDQLHREDNLSQINFDIYITNLATNLFQCYGTNREIQLEVNVNDIFLSLDLSISLGLIINELISNALKYAFPDLYGKIRIQLLSTAESLILTVSDNGIGIPDSFDLKNAKSTGMQLIQSLTEQLEGEFNYYVENGSTFQITVPLP